MSDIIVGVPGPWADHASFVRAVVAIGGTPRFIAAGTVLMDTKTGTALEFEVHDHSPQVPRAFSIACGGRMSEEELRAVAGHKTTAYLIGREGSPMGARQVMTATSHLLRAGGLGVKIESAGLAHGASRWHYFTGSPSILSVYEAFVTLVGGKPSGFHYSCGMHNLGLPDASVAGSVPVNAAAEILTAFNHWALIERPALADGTWFSCATNEPAFLLHHHAYGYDVDDPLNNPYGRWHLEPTDVAGPDDELGAVSGEPLFMAMPGDEEDLQSATERARTTLSYFIEHFRSPHEYGRYLVKVHLRDGPESAYFWALLEKADDAMLVARLSQMPPQFASYRSGQSITVRADEVQDWSILKSGTLIGGFSMRLQRSKLSKEKHRSFDLYTGTLSYAPVEEIPVNSQEGSN